MQNHEVEGGQETTRLFFYALNESVLEVYWHEPPGWAGDVPEALIQDVWRFQQIDVKHALTVQGQPVVVLHPGDLNRDAGPDFLNARIQIGGITISGPIEVHTRSGIWYEHNHHLDAAYDAVVLHVSLESDLWTGRLQTRSGRILPEIALAPLLRLPLRSLLHTFRTRNEEALACRGLWNTAPPLLRDAWIRHLGRERLRSKVARLSDGYLELPDLDQLLYELTMIGLGYSKNAQPMLDLARRVPIALLRQLPTTLEVQSAVLGTAGLIPPAASLQAVDRETVDFVMRLHEGYGRFVDAHPILPMDAHAWRYFRLRPSNFPPLRIAQAAALASVEADGVLAREPLPRISEAIASGRLGNLIRLFRTDPGPFWSTHVRLDRAARRSSGLIGAERIRTLLLNAVAPALLLQSEQHSDARIEEHVYSLVATLKPDQDEITRLFAQLGTPARDGLDAQGQHELYRSYCSQGGCLSCAVGRHILDPARGTDGTLMH